MTPEASTLLTVGGFAVGVIGIAVSVMIAIRSAEKKKPTCRYVTYLKVAASADAPTDIRITYKGNPVGRVSSTLLWLWNAGRKPILRSDIPAAQPLRVRLADGESNPTILDCTVRRSSRPSINFTVGREDETTFGVAFDFLDHEDGVLLEVQHTGGALTVPLISGIVLGAPEGVRVKPLANPSQVKKARPGLHQGVPFTFSSPSRRSRIVASSIVTPFWGFAWVATVSLWTAVEPPSAEQIRTVFKTYMTPQALDSATRALQALNVPRHAPVVGIAAVFVVLIVGTLFLIWGPFRSFPDALDPTRS